MHVNLRCRHKGIDANTDDQATLNFRTYTTGDDGTFFTVLNDLFPVLLLLSFIVRDNRVTLFIFELFEKDFELTTYLEVAHVHELRCVDDTFGFATNVDNYFCGADFDDRSL